MSVSKLLAKQHDWSQTSLLFSRHSSIHLLVIGVAILAMAASMFVEVLDQDETIYALVAQALLDGHLPYSKIFDHKPIGLYYIYAFFLGIFGDSFVSIRIMTMSMLALTSMLVYKSLSMHKVPFNGKLIAVATCFAFPIGLDGLAGNTEIIQNTFLAAIFFLYSYLYTSGRNAKSALFSCGMLVGLGFQVNYMFSFIALFSFSAWFSASLLKGEPLLRLLVKSSLVFLGFCTASLVIFTPFILDWLNGGSAFSQYIADQQNFLSGYAEALNKKLLIEKFYLWVAPFLVIFFAAIRFLFHVPRNQALLGIFALSLLAAAGLVQLLSLRFFNHYWVLACLPIALCAAFIFQQSSNSELNRLITYVHSFVLLCYIASGSESIINHHANRAEAYDFHRAVEYINSHVDKEAPIVSISSTPAYLFTTGVKTQQKFLFPDHVGTLYANGSLDGDAYFLNLLQAEPTHVFSRPTFCSEDFEPYRKLSYPKTCAFISENYRIAAEFKNAKQPLRIFEKNK